MSARSILLRALFIPGVAASLLQAQSAYQVVEVRNGARIIGTVRYTGGDVKTLVTMERTKDEAICGRSKTSGRLVIGEKWGVKNAVISLEGIDMGKKEIRSMRPVLDQKGCEYEPHVMIAPLGSQLEIVNSDPILHNVHTYNLTGKPNPQIPGPPTAFNIAFPIQGLKISKTMEQPGRFLALCDAGHPWMNAYLVVMDHPYYAVTDADGHFALTGIPAGTYELRVWHEGAATVQNNTNTAFLKSVPVEQSKQVSVEASKTATENFELSFP